MPTVSQGTLRADAAEPTMPSGGPGLMPWRWWDTGQGAGRSRRCQPLRRDRLEVPGHRSFQQCTPPGWQPAALLAPGGNASDSWGVHGLCRCAPRCAGEREAPTTPSPPQCPASVGERVSRGWLSRNQSDLALLRHQPRCNARPSRPSLPPPPALPQAPTPRGSGLSWRPPSCWRASGPCEADPTVPRHLQDRRALLGGADGSRLREKRRSSSGPGTIE